MLLLLPSHLEANYIALLTVYKDSVPLRAGPLAWWKQERILFHLVLGRVHARS